MVLLSSVLQNGTVSPEYSQGTCPCFPCWCISLLFFILTSRSRLSHATLLPFLPYFFCLGLTGSWALQKISLMISLLCTSLYPQEQFPRENYWLTPWKAGILLGPNFTPYLPHVPQDCELHLCLITAVQPASNPDVPKELTPVHDYQVHHHLPFPIAWLRKLSWFKTA